MTLTDGEWQTIRDMIHTSVQVQIKDHFTPPVIPDRVSGFAIDRNMMDSWLKQIFEGGYQDIIEWKDKAQKWDDYDIHSLHNNSYCPNYDKAKKWDSFENYFAASGDRDPDKILDKAQKWDEHKCPTGLTQTEKEYIAGLKEKAKTLDELGFSECGKEAVIGMRNKIEGLVHDLGNRLMRYEENANWLVHDLGNRLMRYEENANFWFNWCTCGHHKKLHEDIGTCLDGQLDWNTKTKEYEFIRCACRQFKEVKPIHK